MIKCLQGWSIATATDTHQRIAAFQISPKLVLSMLLLVVSGATFAQRNIRGRLVDSKTKEPVTAAIIRVGANGATTQSDAEGYFKLTVESVDTLVVESPIYPLAEYRVPPVDEFYIELEKPDERVIFTVVEDVASFPGGMGAFYEYIGRNIKYPEAARKDRATGRLFVEFVINTDGTIDPESVKVHKGFHPACDAEAIRLMQQSPPWSPGKQHGKPVRQKMVLPIVFNIAGPAKTKRN
jgi:TonB family protein